MEIEPLNKQNLYLPKDKFSVWDVIWPLPWNWSKLGAIHSWTKLHHEIIQLGAGHSKRDLERCILRGRRSTRDMFIRDVRRSGRRFPERGCVLEHQIFRFAKMILRNRCSTSYDLASLLRGRRSTLHGWSGKVAKRIGTRPSALHSTFLFWRKTRRIA